MWASLAAQMAKNPPAVWAEKRMSAHSSILVWRIPWTEVGYSPRGHKEWNTAEQLTVSLFQGCVHIQAVHKLLSQSLSCSHAGPLFIDGAAEMQRAQEPCRATPSVVVELVSVWDTLFVGRWLLRDWHDQVGGVRVSQGTIWAVDPLGIGWGHLVGINEVLLNSACFPGGLAGKESSCKAGDLGSTPGWGRSPGEGKDYSLQYYSLEKSKDCIVHGVAKSRTRQRLSLHSESPLKKTDSFIFPPRKCWFWTSVLWSKNVYFWKSSGIDLGEAGHVWSFLHTAAVICVWFPCLWSS